MVTGRVFEIVKGSTRSPRSHRSTVSTVSSRGQPGAGRPGQPVRHDHDRRQRVRQRHGVRACRRIEHDFHFTVLQGFNATASDGVVMDAQGNLYGECIISYQVNTVFESSRLAVGSDLGTFDEHEFPPLRPGGGRPGQRVWDDLLQVVVQRYTSWSKSSTVQNFDHDPGFVRFQLTARRGSRVGAARRPGHGRQGNLYGATAGWCLRRSGRCSSSSRDRIPSRPGLARLHDGGSPRGRRDDGRPGQPVRNGVGSGSGGGGTVFDFPEGIGHHPSHPDVPYINGSDPNSSLAIRPGRDLY